MDIYEFLHRHAIPYERHDHVAVYTTEEANRLIPELPGAATKNLFLRDRSGKRHFLLVCADHKTLDLKRLGEVLGVSKLSLASAERLMEHLGITPGAVSILALVNDAGHQAAHQVELVLDRDVWQAEALQAHPLVNTSTLVIPRAGVLAFLEATGHEARVVEVGEGERG